MENPSEENPSGETTPDETPVAAPPTQSRIHNRVSCSSMGEIFLPGGDHKVQMLDISSGGCKIKFPLVEDGLSLAEQLPIEFVITKGPASIPGAFIWFSGGMFGCHFFDHILLDVIADLMTGAFRVRLLPKSAQSI